MTKKRFFSHMLLGGKAAVLPALIPTTAHADPEVVPSFFDVIRDAPQLIQVPERGKVSPKGIGARLNAYGNVSSDLGALLCASSLPDRMAVVVTGLRHGDRLFLVATADKGGNTSLDPRFTIGTKNLTVLTTTNIDASTPGISGDAGARLTATIPVALSELRDAGFSLTRGSSFYLQGIIIPRDAIIPSTIPGVAPTTDFTKIRVTELDRIEVGADTPDGYGNAYGAGGCY